MEINQSKEIMKSIFTRMTIIQLQSMGIDEEDCEKQAKRVMDGKKMGLKFKAAAMASTAAKTTNTKAYSDPDEYVKKNRRRSMKVKSYQCLLISAPEKCKQNSSLEQQEMMSFCRQAFPRKLFDAAAVEDLRVCHEVSRPEQICELIESFFRRRDGVRAKRALHALIIFFGHGSLEGFQVGQDHMPLDTIIFTVKKEWAEALKRDPLWLPIKVKIIFAHCYGHTHKAKNTDKFEVVAFTNDIIPEAYTVKNAAGTYHFKPLTKYVDKQLGPEIVAQQTSLSERIKEAKLEDSDSDSDSDNPSRKLKTGKTMCRIM